MRRVFVNLIDNALESLTQDADEKRILIRTNHDVERSLLVADMSDTGRN